MTETLITVPTKRCHWCNQTGTAALPADGLTLYAAGALVQEAFPGVAASVREQFLSGTHPGCWEQMFPEDPSDL